MNDAANAVQAAPAIEIRFGQVGLAQARVRSTDPGAILDELTGRVAAAPQFFKDAAVCLDLTLLEKPPEAGEIRAAIDAIRRAGMRCIGLVNGSTDVEALARSLDLPVVSQIRAQSKAATLASVKADAPVKAEPPPSPPPTLLHQQPVRSGQKIYARQRDLIVTATVGAGAEVMADGCVHVYGVLRGRAMAGACGDVNARVFCQDFNAELVSIAGVFRVFETIPAELAGKPVQAWLDGDDLRFARIV